MIHKSDCTKKNSKIIIRQVFYLKSFIKKIKQSTATVLLRCRNTNKQKSKSMANNIPFVRVNYHPFETRFPTNFQVLVNSEYTYCGSTYELFEFRYMYIRQGRSAGIYYTTKSFFLLVRNSKVHHVYFQGHGGGGIWRSIGDCDVEDELMPAGPHNNYAGIATVKVLNVYVAWKSHAMYPEHGTWVRACGVLNDVCIHYRRQATSPYNKWAPVLTTPSGEHSYPFTSSSPPQRSTGFLRRLFGCCA